MIRQEIALCPTKKTGARRKELTAIFRYQLATAEYQRSFGIVLLLDPFAEQSVRSIWTDLAQKGITASLPAIACAMPHLTVCICDNLRRESLAGELQCYACQQAPFEIDFAAVGVFPADAGSAVFLQPTVTETLLQAHRQLLDALPTSLIGVNPHYQPGRWSPHCSLGIGLPPAVAKETMDYCLSLSLPLLGRVQAVAVLEMLTRERQVVAGCERLRLRLGDGQRLPASTCPSPADCPFAPEDRWA